MTATATTDGLAEDPDTMMRLVERMLREHGPMKSVQVWAKRSFKIPPHLSIRKYQARKRHNPKMPERTTKVITKSVKITGRRAEDAIEPNSFAVVVHRSEAAVEPRSVQVVIHRPGRASQAPTPPVPRAPRRCQPAADVVEFYR